MEKEKNKKKLILQVAAAAMFTFAAMSGPVCAATSSIGSPEIAPSHAAFASMQEINLGKLEGMLKADLKEVAVEEGKGWTLDFFPEALPKAQAEELQQRYCDGTVYDKAPDGTTYLTKLANHEGMAERNGDEKVLSGIASNGWVVADMKAMTGCHDNFMTKNTVAYRAFTAVHESMHVVLSQDLDLYSKAVAYSFKNDPAHPAKHVTQAMPDEQYTNYVDESVADLATMIYFKSQVQDQSSVQHFAENVSASRAVKSWDYVHETSNVLDHAAPLLGDGIKPEPKSLKQAAGEAINILYKVDDMPGHYTQRKEQANQMTPGTAWPASIYAAQVRLMQP